MKDSFPYFHFGVNNTLILSQRGRSATLNFHNNYLTI